VELVDGIREQCVLGGCSGSMTQQVRVEGYSDRRLDEKLYELATQQLKALDWRLEQHN
jgi:hypothetical protein